MSKKERGRPESAARMGPTTAADVERILARAKAAREQAEREAREQAEREEAQGGES